MRRLALRSLLHSPGNAAAAVAGIAFATVLLLMLNGIYVGYLDNAGGLIARFGGDVWVLGRGTRCVEYGELLPAGVRRDLVRRPGIARVRGLIVGFTIFRRNDGAGAFARHMGQVVGFDRRAEPVMPWALVRGLPADLAAPGRVTIDEANLADFHLGDDPIGVPLDTAVGATVHIAGLTRGIRPFTLSPYLFADLRTAREILSLDDDQVHFWVLDLDDPARAPEVIRAIEEEPTLEALPTARLLERQADHWVHRSGAGAAIAFAALLGFTVGTLIVGQTLYRLAHENLRELATLKALGALDGEIAAFVVWQAAAAALLGGAGGAGVTAAVARALGGTVPLRISAEVGLLAAAAVLVMCALASALAIRKVIVLDAAEVFR